MNIKQFNILLFCTLIISGCSTGPYLKPYAPIGWYSTENPACPGAEKVLEFGIGSYDWLVFRVLAKQPTKYHPEGTKLIAYVRPVIYKHPEPNGTWSLFPSEQEKNYKQKLISERKSQDIEITFSSSEAIIGFSDGSQARVELPFFKKPYKVFSSEYYGIWGPEVLISPNKLEKFSVTLPLIYINGKEYRIPSIKFRISNDKYVPVLNC